MIRKVKPLDEDFVYHSWLHSVKCPTKTVTRMTRCLIDNVIKEEAISVWCPDDDPNHIIGWIAHGKLEDTNLLHFIFVKKNFRKNGIANDLLRHVYPEGTPVFCTFWSWHMQQLDARKKWGAKFVGNLLPSVIYTILHPEEGGAAYAS